MAKDASTDDKAPRSHAEVPEPLGTTAAALLGLLALRPWTTYELAKQAQRSLQWFWPRAERKLYDEPKKLVAKGYATAEAQPTGRRRSTVYSITPAGRRALRDWLGEKPASPPAFEVEQLVRVFFADQGTVDQLRRAISHAGDQAKVALADLGSIVAAAEPGDRELRERDATSAIGLRLVLDLHRAIVGWSEWATETVADWSDTRAPGWDGYQDVYAEAITYARPQGE